MPSTQALITNCRDDTYVPLSLFVCSHNKPSHIYYKVEYCVHSAWSVGPLKWRPTVHLMYFGIGLKIEWCGSRGFSNVVAVTWNVLRSIWMIFPLNKHCKHIRIKHVNPTKISTKFWLIFFTCFCEWNEISLAMLAKQMKPYFRLRSKINNYYKDHVKWYSIVSAYLHGKSRLLSIYVFFLSRPLLEEN